MKRPFPVVRLFAVVLLASVAAHAQSASDKAAAAALFEDGRKLMGDKKIAEACTKFEASEKLDPAPGTLLNLADCTERLGKTATAWVRFRDAAALAKTSGDARRERAARERANALEPKLVRILVDVPQASDVSGLAVVRDGATVERAIWGSAVPVDPGAHEIAASAPGRVAWKTSVDATEAGKTVTVHVPALQPEAPAPVAVSAPPPPVAPPPPASTARPVVAPPPSRPESDRSGSSQRTWAVVAGGVGVVGLGVGTVLGLGALSKWSDAKSHCTNGTTGCDDTATSLSRDARSAGNLSTIAFVVGGVGVAAGIALWLTAPPSNGGAARSLYVAPGVARGGATIDVGGNL